MKLSINEDAFYILNATKNFGLQWPLQDESHSSSADKVLVDLMILGSDTPELFLQMIAQQPVVDDYTSMQLIDQDMLNIKRRLCFTDASAC